MAGRGGGAVAALLQERGADAVALRVPHRLHARCRPSSPLHPLRPRRPQDGRAGGPLRHSPHVPAIVHDGGAAGVFAGAGDPGQQAKETSSGAYRAPAYAVANILVFLPFQLALASVFAAPAYWLTGLRLTAPAFSYFSSSSGWSSTRPTRWWRRQTSWWPSRA
ncbi:hypothetical protein VPH35_038411 [Triticum aestivum]|uniref:ABC transporter G family member 5 n=1 Tax=Aegilops tauschii TaxID=37682 RepID=N1QRT7_AEGTA